MFYFFEIFNRFKYLFISFFFVFFLCYVYKDILLVIFLYSIIENKDGNLNIFEINNFIYTHPTEIFNMYLLLVSYFSCLFIIPFFLWLLLDFFKQSFYKKEYEKIKILSFYLLLLFFFLNFFGLFYIFPNFWLILDSFNKSLFLNMLFELKLNDYIIFLLSFLTLLNFIYLLFYILFYFIKSIGLKKLIDWKKLFVFFNIVFSTLLSPPDIYSQLTVLFLLLFLFEFLLFMYIVILKNKKYIKKVKY